MTELKINLRNGCHYSTQNPVIMPPEFPCINIFNA